MLLSVSARNIGSVERMFMVYVMVKMESHLELNKQPFGRRDGR